MSATNYETSDANAVDASKRVPHDKGVYAVRMAPHKNKTVFEVLDTILNIVANNIELDFDEVLTRYVWTKKVRTETLVVTMSTMLYDAIIAAGYNDSRDFEIKPWELREYELCPFQFSGSPKLFTPFPSMLTNFKTVAHYQVMAKLNRIKDAGLIPAKSWSTKMSEWGVTITFSGLDEVTIALVRITLDCTTWDVCDSSFYSPELRAHLAAKAIELGRNVEDLNITLATDLRETWGVRDNLFEADFALQTTLYEMNEREHNVFSCRWHEERTKPQSPAPLDEIAWANSTNKNLSYPPRKDDSGLKDATFASRKNKKGGVMPDVISMAMSHMMQNQVGFSVPPPAPQPKRTDTVISLKRARTETPAAAAAPVPKSPAAAASPAPKSHSPKQSPAPKAAASPSPKSPAASPASKPAAKPDLRPLPPTTAAVLEVKEDGSVTEVETVAPTFTSDPEATANKYDLKPQAKKGKGPRTTPAPQPKKAAAKKAAARVSPTPAQAPVPAPTFAVSAAAPPIVDEVAGDIPWTNGVTGGLAPLLSEQAPTSGNPPALTSYPELGSAVVSSGGALQSAPAPAAAKRGKQPRQPPAPSTPAYSQAAAPVPMPLLAPPQGPREVRVQMISGNLYAVINGAIMPIDGSRMLVIDGVMHVPIGVEIVRVVLA